MMQNEKKHAFIHDMDFSHKILGLIQVKAFLVYVFVECIFNSCAFSISLIFKQILDKISKKDSNHRKNGKVRKWFKYYLVSILLVRRMIIAIYSCYNELSSQHVSWSVVVTQCIIEPYACAIQSYGEPIHVHVFSMNVLWVGGRCELFCNRAKYELWFSSTSILACSFGCMYMCVCVCAISRKLIPFEIFAFVLVLWTVDLSANCT